MKVNTEFKEIKGMGKIPFDWEVKHLSEIGTYINGKAFKPEDWANNGMKIIRIQNLNGSNEYNYYKNGIEEKYIVRDNDLLFAWSGSRGTSFGPYIWTKGISVLNQHIFKVALEKNVDKLFAYYSLKMITPKIEHNAHGSAGLVHVTKEELSKFKIGIPKNINEQEKIAQILSNVDMNIEKTEQAIAKYKQVKKGLMDDLLTGKVRIKDGKRFRETKFKYVKGVGKIPWDWEVKTLVDICAQIKDGTHGTHKDVANGIPLLSAKDIKNGKVNIPRDCRRISECDYNAIHKNYKLQKNDLLITIVGTIGRMAIIENVSERFTFQRSVGIIRLKNEDFYKYIYYYMNLEKYQRQLEKLVNASAQGGIYLGSLGETYIAKPLLNEQKDIANVLSSQDYIIKKEEEYLEKLKKLKSGLMEDLLTGKVRVNIE